MVRLATAAVLMPLLWALIKLASPSTFAAAMLLVVGVAILESYRMLADARPLRWLGVAAGLGVAGSFASDHPLLGLEVPLTVALLATLVLAMGRREEPAAMLRTTSSTLLPVLLVGLTLGHLVALRGMGAEDGQDLLLLLFLCVIACDSGAYYVGRSLGRHKMAPRLSPKKSWEGAAAGLAGSVIAALVAHAWFYRRLPLPHALALGLTLGVAGMLGDLTESMLKRAAGVKDSSSLLPGHGGLLDRTDSLLFAGPVLYYYYHAFLAPR